MKAWFELQGQHRPVLVIEPEHGTEAILMAAWLQYDANSFNVSVERHEDGQIKSLTMFSTTHGD